MAEAVSAVVIAYALVTALEAMDMLNWQGIREVLPPILLGLFIGWMMIEALRPVSGAVS